MKDVIAFEGEKNGVPVEVAMIYNTSYSENLHSYVNNINTHEGGTHLSGFRRGCLLYTSPSPRDATLSRMPSSA